MPRPSRIVLIDQQPLFLAALEESLRSAWPEIDVVSVMSAEEGFEASAASPTDLVIADWDLLEGEAGATIWQVVRKCGATGLILLVNKAQPGAIRAGLAAGVRSILPRTLTGECLRCAVSLALNGVSCLPNQALGDFGEVARAPASAPRMQREFEILDCLERGDSNKIIARRLGVSVATVKLHIQAILRLTGAKNRTEAVALARRMGLPNLSA